MTITIPCNSVIFVFAVVVFFTVYKELKLIRSCRIQEEQWIKDSFEFNRGRYNKKFFTVIDGKLVEL